MGELQQWLAGRPLVVAASGYCIGIASAARSTAEPWICAVAAGVIALLSLRVRRPLLHLLSLVAIFGLAGIAVAGARTQYAVGNVGEGEVLLEGTAQERARHSAGRTRLLLRVDTHLVDGRAEPVHFGVRLSCRGEAQVLAGDRIRVRARLFVPTPPANPGAWDWAARLAAEGTRFSGGCRAEELVVLDPPSLLTGWAESFRERYRELASAAIPDPDAAGLVVALAIGDRADISEQINDEFAASGLAHLLSVSGLHVTVIAAGLFWLLRRLLSWSERLLLSGHVPTLAAVFAVPACWAYVGLTGSEVPAVRSGLMASVLLLARVFRRDPDSAATLAAALLVVLGLDPAALHDVSFQLSFVALAALVLLTDPLVRLVGLAPREGDGRLRRGARQLASAGAASLAATLSTVPIVAELFHRVSLVSVLTNLLALPLSTAVTALAALSTVFAGLHEAPAGLALVLAGLSAEWTIALSRFTAGLPFSTLALPSFELPTTLLWYAGLASLRLHQPWRVWPRRIGAVCAAGLTLFGAAYLIGPKLSGDLTVTFLSVGQGDAVLVRFPHGRTILVDAGGDPSGSFDPGARIILPALAELGVLRIDTFALSHPHADHLLGALSLFGRIPIDEVWWAEGTEERSLLRQLRELAEREGAGIRTLAAPQTLSGFEPARLELLHPKRVDAATSVNDASMVLRVSLGEISFLLTGDIEAESEEALGEAVTPTTVLKAPHHGSRTSSTEAFVRRVAPRHVVFCVGRNNRFRFPHDEIEERYRSAGCTLHRTDLHGAIQFRTDGKKLEIERMLD